MKQKAFINMAGGQLLKIKNDGGYLAGYGARFSKLSPCGHMAIVMCMGRVEWISLNRLEGV